MSHAIHRVEYFEIVGPYTLALRFETGASSESTFDRYWKAKCLRPFRISRRSTRSNSTRRSERCNGQTVQTLIPRRCTIGPSIAMNSSRWRDVGPRRQRRFADQRVNTRCTRWPLVRS